ncbi:MAG: hypothetical protein QMD10_11265 [Desulfitobacteriaceae bacterium]|nr:hypothetical protein [Desulfitobacteriaceae bacterium]
MVEGAISGILKAMGPKAFRLMVEKDYHTVSILFYALTRKPDYAKEGLSPEEAGRLEAYRLGSLRTILPILGMVRTFASRFPSEAVEAKVTADWLMKRAERSRPEIAEIIKEYGEKGWAWLEGEAEELREYFLGRLMWDNEKGIFVKKVKSSG